MTATLNWWWCMKKYSYLYLISMLLDNLFIELVIPLFALRSTTRSRLDSNVRSMKNSKYFHVSENLYLLRMLVGSGKLLNRWKYSMPRPSNRLRAIGNANTRSGFHVMSPRIDQINAIMALIQLSLKGKTPTNFWEATQNARRTTSQNDCVKSNEA